MTNYIYIFKLLTIECSIDSIQQQQQKQQSKKKAEIKIKNCEQNNSRLNLIWFNFQDVFEAVRAKATGKQASKQKKRWILIVIESKLNECLCMW